MKQRMIIFLFGLGIYLGLSVITGSKTQTAQAESTYQNTPCAAVLVDAASRAGIVADEVEWFYDRSDPWSCYARFTYYDEMSIEVEFRLDASDFGGNASYTYDCSEDKFCHPTSFHGFPAVMQEGSPLEFFWYVNPTGGMGYVLRVGKRVYSGVEPSEVMALAEALWSAAEPALPWQDENSQANPGEQPEGEVPTFPEGQTGGEQPEGGVPTNPEDQTGSDQSKSLGPLATTPLVPLAGGLIGTVIGWLVSVAVSSGNPISATPRPLETAAPPSVPIEKTPGPLESGFNLVKDTASAIGNVAGVFNKYFAGPDTAETVMQIRDAVTSFHKTPSVLSVANYLDNLRKSNVLREPELSSKLGRISKGLDIVEAVAKAKKICEDRGYSGSDALLRTYAEVGKKAVTWGLTKNPVVALADAAVGGATQLVFGAKNKIDIGAAVDKTAEAWDNVTRHAGDRYYRGIEASADNERVENLKSLTERIRQQVVDGKISSQEGARRLQNVIDKTNQESPLL